MDRGVLEKLLKGTPIEKESSYANKEENNTNLDEHGLPLLNDEIFMKTIQELERTERTPIPHRLLIKNLMKTGKFTETFSNSMIWNMMAEKIYQFSEGHYNSLTPEIKLEMDRRGEGRKRKRATAVSKMLRFIRNLQQLEENSKNLVHRDVFVEKLVQTGYFTEQESYNYIRMMLHETSIYESKPLHYNTI